MITENYENYDKENFDKVYNYLFTVQREDGKIEADVFTFKKQMTKEEFQLAFEGLQKPGSAIKGSEVVYLGFSFYKKEYDVVFSFGEIKIEEGGEEHDREQESSIQKSIE